jgi:hypothetical protein
MLYDDNGRAWVATSLRDFEGWEILGVVPFKENSNQVRMRKVHANGEEFRIVYCSPKHTPLVPQTSS